MSSSKALESAYITMFPSPTLVMPRMGTLFDALFILSFLFLALPLGTTVPSNKTLLGGILAIDVPSWTRRPLVSLSSSVASNEKLEKATSKLERSLFRAGTLAPRMAGCIVIR